MKSKGDNEENRQLGQVEIDRCHEMGIEPNIVLRMEDMAQSDNVIFAGTGITKGDLLEGDQPSRQYRDHRNPADPWQVPHYPPH